LPVNRTLIKLGKGLVKQKKTKKKSKKKKSQLPNLFEGFKDPYHNDPKGAGENAIDFGYRLFDPRRN